MCRLLLRLLCGLCLAYIPVSASAQQANSFVLDQRLTDRNLELLVYCSTAAPAFNLTLAGKHLEPPVISEVAPPPQVIFLIEEGPALDLPGSPARTRRADGLALTSMLLERLPETALAGLVLYDQEARSLIRPTSPATLREALTRATPGAAAASSSSFGAALSRTLDDLAQTPYGPQLVVILAAEQLDLPAGAAPPNLSLLLIDLAQHDAATTHAMAAALGATYLAHGTTDPALISERLAAIVHAFDAAVTPVGYFQLTTTLPASTSGEQNLLLEGCDQQADIRLDLAAPQSIWPWPLLLAAPLPLLGLLIRRRGPKAAPNVQTRPQLHSGPRTITSSFQVITDLPTERHGQVPAVADAEYTLEIWNGTKCEQYPCKGRQWTIGRNQGCDICIESAWLSGLHARIAVRGDGLEITDLDSANGTFVGSERRRLIADVAEALEPGEPIAFGPQLLAVIRRVSL